MDPSDVSACEFFKEDSSVGGVEIFFLHACRRAFSERKKNVSRNTRAGETGVVTATDAVRRGSPRAAKSAV